MLNANHIVCNWKALLAQHHSKRFENHARWWLFTMPFVHHSRGWMNQFCISIQFSFRFRNLKLTQATFSIIDESRFTSKPQIFSNRFYDFRFSYEKRKPKITSTTIWNRRNAETETHPIRKSSTTRNSWALTVIALWFSIIVINQFFGHFYLVYIQPSISLMGHSCFAKRNQTKWFRLEKV